MKRYKGIDKVINDRLPKRRKKARPEHRKTTPEERAKSRLALSNPIKKQHPCYATQRQRLAIIDAMAVFECETKAERVKLWEALTSPEWEARYGEPPMTKSYDSFRMLLWRYKDAESEAILHRRKEIFDNLTLIPSANLAVRIKTLDKIARFSKDEKTRVAANNAIHSMVNEKDRQEATKGSGFFVTPDLMKDVDNDLKD